jgi:Flp pilus assembly protein TadG
MMQSLSRSFHRWQSAVVAGYRRLEDNSGSATLELALTFSVLAAPLMLGASETAFMVYDSIEVSNAAHAGAMYGMYSQTFATNTTQIQAVAQAEAADLKGQLTVTPTVYFACSATPGGTQYTTQIAATQACGSTPSNHSLEFVQVATSATINPPLHVPGLPNTWTLKGFSVMEVQE